MSDAVDNSLQQPVINIQGERVSLGPFAEEHLEAFHRWHNDYETMRTWISLPRPRTLTQASNLYKYWVDQSDWQSFAIYENASWRHIGATLLIDIHHTDGTAEFGIMIGEPDARGKGYGTEATALMLDHAFLALGLSNVMLRVYSYNLAGIHVYEKVGFRVMGIRRKSKLMGGKLWDTIYMEALADEFESPVLGKILVPDQPR
ncbi:MAG: GNAT family protein [Thermomicrobiales bacterium]